MKFLVTLAICAVCVSGESLTRHKRGWGYEPTTQAPGWGWNHPPTPPPPPPPPPPTNGWGWKPTPPPPPPPPPPTHGWGWPQPTEPPGWGRPRPTSGWSSGSSYYNTYDYGQNYLRPIYSRPRPYNGGYLRSRNIRRSDSLL